MEHEKKKMQQTSKKQKFVGYKELVDPDTGEMFPMQMNVIEDRDFNFHKVWLQNLVQGIDEISNQKLRLAFWIIENLNKENQLIMTQRQIAEKTGMSLQTVSRTIRALCKKTGDVQPFLQKINSGAYMVNPNMIYKGAHNNRLGICYTYNTVGNTNDKN